MKSTDLAGVFGMTEMEAAAARILTLMLENGLCGDINDMTDDLERIGYVELLACGWLERRPDHAYNGDFQPTQEFFSRCKIAPPVWWKPVGLDITPMPEPTVTIKVVRVY